MPQIQHWTQRGTSAVEDRDLPMCRTVTQIVCYIVVQYPTETTFVMQSVAIGENPNSSRYEGCSGEAAE